MEFNRILLNLNPVPNLKSESFQDPCQIFLGSLFGVEILVFLVNHSANIR